MQQNATLTHRQREAITLLLAGQTATATAEECGINRSTLHRWKAEPEFQAAYQAAADEAFREALATLKGAAGRAVGALNVALDFGADNVDPSRLRAATIILQHVLRAHEQLDLSRRLDEAERRLHIQQRRFNRHGR